MAVQVGAACYETPIIAAQAAASGQLGVVQSPAGLYSINFVGATDTTIEYSLTAMDGGAPLANVVVPFNAPPCALLDYADATDYGWLLLAAWAGAWAIKFLARQVRER